MLSKHPSTCVQIVIRSPTPISIFDRVYPPRPLNFVICYILDFMIPLASSIHQIPSSNNQTCYNQYQYSYDKPGPMSFGILRIWSRLVCDHRCSLRSVAIHSKSYSSTLIIVVHDKALHEQGTKIDALRIEF